MHGWARTSPTMTSSVWMDIASSEQKLPEKKTQWYAELLLGMADGLMDFLGHRQVKSKQKIVPLPAPLPQGIDEEA